jgi:hypothetical protein
MTHYKVELNSYVITIQHTPTGQIFCTTLESMISYFPKCLCDSREDVYYMINYGLENQTCTMIYYEESLWQPEQLLLTCLLKGVPVSKQKIEIVFYPNRMLPLPCPIQVQEIMVMSPTISERSFESEEDGWKQRVEEQMIKIERRFRHIETSMRYKN